MKKYRIVTRFDGKIIDKSAKLTKPRADLFLTGVRTGFEQKIARELRQDHPNDMTVARLRKWTAEMEEVWA